MAATLLSENASENLRAGFLDLGVVQVWQVITASRTVPFTTVLLDPGLPGLGSSNVFDTFLLFVISRTPARVEEDATGKLWNVTVTYSNNQENFARNSQGEPVTDPTDQVKNVSVEHLEYSEPITDAIIKNVTELTGYIDPATGLPQTVTVPVPPYLPTTSGPVRVSTGEIVLAERVNYRQNITISRVEADWTALYETYTNALNNAQVVITESDSVGVKATYTFEALTLRMKPIKKTPVWHDSILYFRIAFQMEHNELTWIHSEADVSQKRRVFADQTGPPPTPAQRKPDGTDYTQQEVDDNVSPPGSGLTFYYTAITTGGGKDANGKKIPEVAVGDRVPLNGYGNETPLDRADGTIYTKDGTMYINSDIYPVLDYSVLNL